MIYGQHAKNVAKTMPLLHGLMEDRPYFILIVGGPIGPKTMPPFNTNPNKNTRVIFLVKIFQQTERNGAKNYLDVLSKPQTICIKSCMVL